MNYLRRGRPRRDQWSSPHQKARTLAAERLGVALEEGERAWLDRHLAECPSCAAIAGAYEEQRSALRALRTVDPAPPRDLWARTAAAIEREAARSHRAEGDGRRGVGRRRARPAPIPLGVLSGALVVVVVVGASLLSRGTPLTPLQTAPPSGTPRPIASPGPTPLAISPGDLAWIKVGEDGGYGLIIARIDQVCPGRDEAACAPISESESRAIENVAAPQAVVLSPTADELVVVDDSGDGSGGTVFVVPVPAPTEPGATPTPAPAETPTVTPTGTPAPTPAATPTPTPVVNPSATPVDVSGPPPPSESPTGSPGESLEPSGSPLPSPPGSTAIASGVVLVGDSAAYSPDGQWFAFSALPADKSHGPDIYVWHVGDGEARIVTTDHHSVFAQWLGGQVLGSRVLDPASTAEPDASSSPGPSSLPGASSAPAASPTLVPKPAPSGSPAASSPDPSTSESTSESASEQDLTARVFVVDPATGIETVFLDVPLWRPTVDPTARWAVFWDGSLVADETGTAWLPGDGRLVLGGWPIGMPEPPIPPDLEPEVSGSPTDQPSATPRRSPRPSAAVSLSPTPGPSDAAFASPSAGASGPDESGGPDRVIAAGHVTGWQARWDPSGTRLAIWIADRDDPTIGRLSLYVVDTEKGSLERSERLLRDQPALAGFSLGDGLLAWATPPGQDGEGSRIQVLAWSGDAVGSAETQPGSDPVVIAR